MPASERTAAACENGSAGDVANTDLSKVATYSCIHIVRLAKNDLRDTNLHDFDTTSQAWTAANRQLYSQTVF